MMSRKTYDNMARDAFAEAVGIDIGDGRGGVFDEFHAIEVARLEEERSTLLMYCAEWKRLRNKEHHRGDIWKLLALFGWGMFVIACVTHYLK